MSRNRKNGEYRQASGEPEGLGQENGADYAAGQAGPHAPWTAREAYLLAAVCLLTGLLLGYLLRGSGGLTATSGTPPQSASQLAGGGLPGNPAAPPDAKALEPVVAPLLMMLEQDAKNADVLTQIGNLYYDHHAYRQAVPYYRRALETRPDDANIRTDLGTALWMSGDPRAALSEYEQVLRKNPNFAPALMNTGIVRLNGLNDAQGAIDAWEKLLATNPQFSERQRVLDLLAQARGSVPAGRAAPR